MSNDLSPQELRQQEEARRLKVEHDIAERQKAIDALAADIGRLKDQEADRTGAKASDILELKKKLSKMSDQEFEKYSSELFDDARAEQVERSGVRLTPR